MSVLYKCLPLLLIVALIFSSCGRPATGDDEHTTLPASETAALTLRAPYAAQDSMNPYFCISYINDALMPLLYDGLFSVGADGAVYPLIGASYTENGSALTAALPVDTVFSDGSALTAADVVYSFIKAKASALYSGALSGISAANAVSAYEVQFLYADSFPGKAALLTFPIVKNGTAERADSLPVGSGRFVLTRDSDGAVLTVNPHSGRQGRVGAVSLVETSDTGKLKYMLETGEIDFFCSDLYGARMARSGATMYAYSQNSLVYLGAHADYMSRAQRRILAYAVNRAEIADSVYSGFAEAAILPFRGQSKLVTANMDDTLAAAVDTAAAEQMLREEGVTYAPAGTLQPVGGETLSLLVNAESGYRMEAAECIKNNLAQVGITVNIRSLPFAAYTEALENGNYELYLGEVKLPGDGSLDAFFGGNAGYGIAETSVAYAAYQAVEDGSGTVAAFLTAFLEDFPFIPLCFRSDLLVCGGNIAVPGADEAFGSPLSALEQWQVV
ncbi:MAG: hypothetical protein IJ766_08605 [Clostridia bacterium]|nr:hypothetical protein [Clostridia bacterium]